MEKFVLGIDIGGTNLRIGIVSRGGELIAEGTSPMIPVAKKGAFTAANAVKLSDKVAAEVQLAFIVSAINNFIDEYSIKGYDIDMIGIGVAGQVAPESGNVVFSPNLKWRDVPLRKAVEGATGLKTAVANDLTAITYGEWIFGSGRGHNNLICIFVGTGIGSGIIVGGSLLEGCSGTAGELGHTTVVSGGRECACGNRGCLEAYAGGWGMSNIAAERADSGDKEYAELAAVLRSCGRVTAADIGKYYLEGNRGASIIIKEAAEYLSDGIISAVNLLNPCAVILGGGVIEGIPDMFDIVKKEVNKRALGAAVSGMAMVGSGLGKDAGIIGAAALVMRKPSDMKA